MVSSSGTKRILLLVGLGVFALFIVGLVIGAVGSSFVDKSGYVPKPEVHLPAQPVFPARTRDESLNLTPVRFAIHVPQLDSLGRSDLEAAQASIKNALAQAQLAPISHFSPEPAEELSVELVREMEVTFHVGTEHVVSALQGFPGATVELEEGEFLIETPGLTSDDEGDLRKALEGIGLIHEYSADMKGDDLRKVTVEFAVTEQEVAAALMPFYAEAKVNATKIEGHFKGLGALEFAVTNTMLSSWVATIALLLLFVWGARKASLVPGRLQNLVEIMIEALLRFVETVVGRAMSRAIFPMIATIFLFVLFNAWLALLPIWPSIGFTDGEGELKAHLLRSAGTDINMPLALALISFVFVEYWGFRSKGLAYLGKFFSISNLLKLRVANLFVGLLELISELVRIVSFTFRLFGNMLAGEILVVMIAFLVPFVALDLVYGLELLVGLVQALIFAGLTLVFVSVAMAHDSH